MHPVRGAREMTFGGCRIRGRTPPLLRPTVAAICLLLAPAASAQEPLFLRIRAIPEADPAMAARTAREAVWMRSEVRARAAIAAVCTGCLDPREGPQAIRRAPPAERLAPLSAPRGPEPAPVSEASDVTTEQPIRQERP